ncbi:lyase family protein [Cytobacillus sp. FSL W7-1323]|uniref:argininosuccinate lyase n=1 Tax=unclassified Cytobacillus TaxID=2675268 RepID=UPI002AFEA0FF|nr:lyase family protein [Cytobacillus sp. OWB-43]MEA1853790.1 lyase family protein [Cytobacillus sp. OWB-43]
MTGRVKSPPHEIMNKLILYPQLLFESDNYLEHYLSIEKVLIKSYEEMNLINTTDAVKLLESVKSVQKENIIKSAYSNMNDIAFSIEKAIDENLGKPVLNWHLDRSRNDLQACGQLMYARDSWISLIQKFQKLLIELWALASKYKRTIMPGYTHFQTAQVMSVGFYLTAISRHIQKTLEKMVLCLESINESCPLGSGAMSGQEYPWDLEMMANDLGFDSFGGHALVCVASRDWILEIGESLAFFGVNMSRFMTDMMNWGSSEYQFLHFPDELVGISSSMPQKRNLPILERIRGKTSHLISYYQDFMLGQRNTPFSNLVEVSKESSSNLPRLFQTANDIADLLLLIFENIDFNINKMKKRCEEDYLGGFTLANYLSAKEGIPYRKAQVISGEFITLAINEGIAPKKLPILLLSQVCERYGYKQLQINQATLVDIFDPEKALFVKITAGSVHPEEVNEIIECQKRQNAEFIRRFNRITEKVTEAKQRLDKWVPGKENVND